MPSTLVTDILDAFAELDGGIHQGFRPVHAKGFMYSGTFTPSPGAAKLTRANASVVEALAKHRNKGTQKVIVEHVHVYAGGQAIVGNIAPGEGVAKLNEVQPHAITHEASGPMRCANPQADALPIASDGERTLQDARRPIAGRA